MRRRRAGRILLAAAATVIVAAAAGGEEEAAILSPDCLVVSSVHSAQGRVASVGVLETRLSVYLWVPPGTARFTLGVFDQADDTPVGAPSRFDLYAPDGKREPTLLEPGAPGDRRAWSDYPIHTGGRWGVWRLAVTGPEDPVSGDEKGAKAENAFRLRVRGAEPYLRPEGAARVRGVRFGAPRFGGGPTLHLTAPLPGTADTARFLVFRSGGGAGGGSNAFALSGSDRRQTRSLEQDDRLPAGVSLTAFDLHGASDGALAGWRTLTADLPVGNGVLGIGTAPETRLFFSERPGLPLPVATAVQTVDERGRPVAAVVEAISSQTVNEPLRAETDASGRARLSLLPGVAYTVSAAAGPDRETATAQRVTGGTSLRLALRRTVEPLHGWYGGDPHLHTHWYDGTDSPAQMAAAARAAGLDWIVQTEHAHGPVPERARVAFAESREAVRASGGGLIVIPGLEWTTATFHANVLGAIPDGLRAGAGLAELAETVTAARRKPGAPPLLAALAVNHPTIGKTAAGLLRAAALSANPPELVELWNSPEPAATRLWWDLLNAGAPLFAETGSDSHHRGNAPPGYRRTFVYPGAASPTPANVVSALRAGRSFLSRRGVLLSLRVQNALPGGTATPGANGYVVAVEARSPIPLDRIEIVRRGEVVAVLPAAGRHTLRQSIALPAASIPHDWLLAQAWAAEDCAPEPAALTNPVFLGAASAAPTRKELWEMTLNAIAELDLLPRRRFLQGAAGLLTAAVGLSATSSPAAAADARDTTPETDAFSFLLLGDLHFDRLAHHDMAWLKAEKPNDVHQVENYSRITRECLPPLLTTLTERIRADRSVRFVAHVGDFVEGLAGTPELALRHTRDAVACFEAAGLGKPLVFCKGNHDVTGPGAVAAFDQVLMPYVARQAAAITADAPAAGETCFAVRPGNDTLLLFYDAYRPDSLDWLEKALAKRTERTLFVVIHPPVVPYDARSNWHIFARPSEAASRERLLRLLGRHRAVVLCGHLHKYGTVVRQTPEGPFVQMAVISILPRPDARAKDVVQGVGEYGPDLVRLEAEFSPSTLEERRRLLAEEKPFIRYFDYADAPGWAQVRVGRDGKATAELYTGAGGGPVWKSLPLSDLLTAGA